EPACHTPRAAHALASVARRAVRRCAACLVPSEATRRDAEELLRLPRDRVFVTPLGVGPEFFLRNGTPKSSRPYLLAVGTLEPRKNYPRLIRAFRRVAARRPGLELRIAGKRGWLCDDVVEACGGPVRLVGHLGEEELREQLAGATAVLYPSLREGFGLPVLEALAAGAPVLTSDRSPLRELAGDAALLVDPESEEAIAAGIERLVEDESLRAALGARGPARARGYTWEACAAATLKAYEAVLS
ncbi:MAG: glycosyltransferase family 4 protein, partial [Planctomycetota bacterium]